MCTFTHIGTLYEHEHKMINIIQCLSHYWMKWTEKQEEVNTCTLNHWTVDMHAEIHVISRLMI